MAVYGAELNFTEHQLSSENYWTVSGADLDNDNDVDIFTADYNTHTLLWFENDGAQNFSIHSMQMSSIYPYDVIAADLNQDGLTDILASGTYFLGAGGVTWYENQGDLSFKEYFIGTRGIRSIFAVDLDLDNDTDVLAADWYDDRVRWYENDGTHNFIERNVGYASSPASVFPVDLDEDGDIDVIAPNRFGKTNYKILWFENDGTENFTTHIINVSLYGPHSVSSIDLDLDGDFDILGTGYWDGMLAWYENDGDEIFTEHIITTSVSCPNEVIPIDLDLDGDVDIISVSDCIDTSWYENDGTQGFTEHIFADSGAWSAFPVDLDDDEDVDLLLTPPLRWYENMQFTLACTNGLKDNDETEIDCGGSCPSCSYGKSCLIDSDCESNYCNNGVCDAMLDLSVSSIYFATNGQVDVSALVENKGESIASNVEVEFMHVFDGNLITETTVNIGSLNDGVSKSTTVSFDLEIGDKVYVVVDPSNKIEDEDRSNNNAFREYTGTLRYYVSADVPPSSEEIETYIKNGIKGVVVNDEEEADVKVLVARHNPLIMWHFGVLETEGWGFYGGGIRFQDKTCDKPYCGVVGSVENDGKKQVYIEANDIDGFVAASKEFVDKQDFFKVTGNAIYLGEDSEEGIAVYDYLHTPSNLVHYKNDSDEFKEIVSKALEGEMFDEEQINTTAGGVTLRLLHLKPAFSDKFVDYKDQIKMPVVLARGLWSNLYTWRDFGEELSTGGRDTWLIEITGGPGQDCDTCSNYDFDDLTDSYVPALLDKVLSETGKSELQYVGFSNGCRSTLSSLEKGSFDPSKVDTFVGVGCPGAFEGESTYKTYFGEYGEEALQYLVDKDHIDGEDVSNALKKACDENINCRIWAGFLNLLGDNSISYNLIDQYLQWIKLSSDEQPGESLAIDNFAILYGYLPKFYNSFGVIVVPGHTEHDLMVTKADAYAIYNNLDSENKSLFKVMAAHGGGKIMGLSDVKKTKSIVKKTINQEELSFWEKTFNLVESTD